MFHVVKEGSVPEFLVSDYLGAQTHVECGAPSGNRREAIPYRVYKKYASDGKLRVKNMCSACARKLGIRKPRKEEVEDVTT